MTMLQVVTLSALIVCLSACEVEDPRLKNQAHDHTNGRAQSGTSSRPASGPATGFNGGANPQALASLNAANAKAEELLKEIKAARSELAQWRQQMALTQSNGEGSDKAGVMKQQNAKMMVFDHSDFDKLLQKYVKNGFVDYKAWKANDLKSLDSYLARVRACNPDKLSTKAEKMAFWINVYNAWTLRSMLELYPTKSILDHAQGKAKAHKGGIWKANPIQINKRAYTLDAIEHQILRKMGDSRIHFGIVCASIGCPPLASTAYTAAKLSEQLDKTGQRFFADPQKFQVDAATKTVKLSKIFSWFMEDFAPNKKHSELLKALSRFVTNKQQKAIMLSPGAKVEFLDYNWNINDKKR